MSKITQYLNEHILGEATSDDHIRQAFATDGSFLTIKPEIVASPRVTNDIRKIARFSWQLAEKGHILPITVRGEGCDYSGAAIGKGVILNTVAHMNKIIYVNLKSKDLFVHVQPGVNFRHLNMTLKTHGLTVPAYPSNDQLVTVGGALANNSFGPMSGQAGSIGDWVKKVEVILANGDLIEVERVNRRDLNKKKGLQTFEGEIYRKLDGIIEDYKVVIESLKTSVTGDNTGYPGITKVKNKDGSIDLTPLFLGSQGTLGIISEAVIRSEYIAEEETAALISFNDRKQAMDMATEIAKSKPSRLEVIDQKIFDSAQKQGKKYPFMEGSSEANGAVLFVGYSDYNSRVCKRKLKHLFKKLSKMDVKIVSSNDYSLDEIYAMRDVTAVVMQNPERGDSYMPTLFGSAISEERRDLFLGDLAEMAEKYHIDMPVVINWFSGMIMPYYQLKMHQVGDKQKSIKIIDDYMEIVAKHGGAMNRASGEGRLKASASYKQLEDQVVELYEQIRQVFDPFGTLNPGVKQHNETKTLVSHMDKDYNLAKLAKDAPR